MLLTVRVCVKQVFSVCPHDGSVHFLSSPFNTKRYHLTDVPRQPNSPRECFHTTRCFMGSIFQSKPCFSRLFSSVCKHLPGRIKKDNVEHILTIVVFFGLGFQPMACNGVCFTVSDAAPHMEEQRDADGRRTTWDVRLCECVQEWLTRHEDSPDLPDRPSSLNSTVNPLLAGIATFA